MLRLAGESAVLLVAPTGGGKTLAGFLPSMAELSKCGSRGLHTLYVSPLKALTSDIRRNLEKPIEELSLNLRVEDRTGETSQFRRKRQRDQPPDILLTTPESLSLLISYEEAPRIFRNLRRVIVDEIHSLAESKRGDQLALCLTRLQAISPNLRRVGLSATVRDTTEIADFLSRKGYACKIVRAEPGPNPEIDVLQTAVPPPWNGGGARHAIPEVLNAIRGASTTLVFINTRAQAELFFRALWQENSEEMPIAIHHGSLSQEARKRVEFAMGRNQLRAVVCTGTLDLGIDWGNVDLVIQVGAPKNVKRLVQRIGRSNHSYNRPSRALIVPANRFEALECIAALDAVRCNDIDGEPRGSGALDVLCQHILIVACSGPFDAAELHKEVVSSGPYSGLSKKKFNECVDFCATGGYALRAYRKWHRLQLRNGLWQLRDPRHAGKIRMNVGTIVDSETMQVRMRRRAGRPLGEIEEAFAATLVEGDSFLIGGEVVRYEGIRDMTVEVSRNAARHPKIAVFSGTKFSTSTLLCSRVLDILHSGEWQCLPFHLCDWLQTQRNLSAMPRPDSLLIESFVHEGLEYSCFYGFAGRNALQTLGLLLTKRMEDRGLNPIGFVSNDYAVLIWSLDRIDNPEELISREGLKNSLDDWLAKNAVMKRTFRNTATVAGLVEKTVPGKRKSGRQITFSTDIIYDTLRKYDPDHLLLTITRDEAMRGLVDYSRIEAMLDRIGDRIDWFDLPQISPFAAPLLLEVGKIPISGGAEEMILATAADKLMRSAGLKIGAE